MFQKMFHRLRRISLAEILFYMLIAAFGAIAFLAAVQPGITERMQEVWFSIGSAFIGIGIGGIGYRLLLSTDPLTNLTNQVKDLLSLVKRSVSSYPALENVTDMGVVELLSDRNEFKLDKLLELMKNAKELDLLGVAHAEIIHDMDFRDALFSFLASRRACRIILLDPNSLEMVRRQEYESDLSDLKGRTEGSIKIIKDVCEAVVKAKNPGMDQTSEEFQQQVKDYLWRHIRLYTYAPSCMIIRTDDDMVVANYVFGKGGHSPALKLQKPGKLFKIFCDHFEKTWQKASENTQYGRSLLDSDFKQLFGK
jgi:hypothetical protein